MCAKVAQNHEAKEQKANNPSKVLLSRIFYVPLPRQRTIETGWWLSVGSSSRSEATKEGIIFQIFGSYAPTVGGESCNKLA